MSPIDMLEIPLLREPRLSPDGTQLLYLLQQADWEVNRRVSHIWRVNVDGSDSIQLTNGVDGERSPRWSPDGRQVAFLAERGEGDEELDQIYLLANRGGEARRLTQHDTDVGNIAWSPDGKFLYFLAKDPKSPEQKEREEAKDDVYAFDEDYQQKHLWRVSLADASEHRITEGDYSVLDYGLSRDGSKVSFHRAPTPLYDDSDEGEVWLMDSSGENPVRLTHNTVAESGAELSPDNSQVLFRAGANAEFDSYYNDNLFVVPASGGEHRLLLAEMPYEVDAASWSTDGRSIYFLASAGVRSDLFAVDLENEEAQRLTNGDHTTRDWSHDPRTDRHVFTRHSATNAGDVWTMAAGSTVPAARITQVFDYLGRDFLIPRLEAIQWPGADGTTVEGLLVYPLDYEPGKAYPLVVQTHGGPASADKYSFGRWRNYEPVLAAMGYAVFKPNYRGSTGYGDDFLRDMVGHYYRQSHLDVMTGVDRLIGLGIADADHLVKMGWSAGGHMTNKIITHTDRFKAASSGAGAVNWISMYGQSDVRIYRTPWFGGTPWQEDAPIDTYWAHSPLSDIYRVTTPTLVLVGENDVRVPPPQSVELYRALKTNGVPTHLYIAPREPHGWRELRHELFKINVELEWFEKHAMGREYVWAEAPASEEEAEQENEADPEP